MPAREADLNPGKVAAPPPARRFRASRGTPSLFAFPRRPLVPGMAFDPVAPRPSAFVYTPAVEEAEMLRRLGRDCLEDIAIHRDLRKANADETWLDQEPFEQRLLENLDCFIALGDVALPLISAFFAEARSPDPGRAFAVALTLGSIEGRDALDAAIAMLEQSAPETHPGWVEGFHLAPSPSINAALVELAMGSHPQLVAVALEALVLRQAAPFDLARRLAASERPAVAEQAARALAVSGPHGEAIAVLEDVMAAAKDDAVFLAAAESAMRRGHAGTRTHLCAALAENAKPDRGNGAAWLLCLGGQPDDLDALLARLNAAPAGKLVRGLGRFGHVEALGPLVGLLGSADERLAAAAAEALDRITGAGLREMAAAAWGAWVREHASRLDPRVRMRGGRPFSPIAILSELARGSTPPLERQDAAVELAIATRIPTPLSPDDWVARQREHLSDLAGRVEQLAFRAGAWAS